MLVSVTQAVQVLIGDEGPIGIPDGHVVLTPLATCAQTKGHVPFCLIGDEHDIAAISSIELQRAVNIGLFEAGWEQTAQVVPARHCIIQ